MFMDPLEICLSINISFINPARRANVDKSKGLASQYFICHGILYLNN